MKFKRIRLIPKDEDYNIGSVSPIPLPGKISPVLLQFDRQDNLIGIEVPHDAKVSVEGESAQPVIPEDTTPKKKDELFPPFDQLLNKLNL